MAEFDGLQSTLMVLLFVSVFFNIKQKLASKKRTESESRLIKKAYFDPVTELPNRDNIDIVLNEQIARISRHKKSFLVAVIKVTNYHEIKLKPRAHSKELITEVGDRILDSIRDEDMLARISEDKFTLVFNEYLEEVHLDILFKRIKDAFKEEVEYDKGSVAIKITIGKSKYPEDATDSKGLINEAMRKALILI